MSTSEFDEFWAAYPRRVAKGDARKAWERAAKRLAQGALPLEFTA